MLFYQQLFHNHCGEMNSIVVVDLDQCVTHLIFYSELSNGTIFSSLIDYDHSQISILLVLNKMYFLLRHMKLVTFQKVFESKQYKFMHSLLNVFPSDKFNVSLAINFEMVPSATKPPLAVFNSRMFSLLSKSMSQIFLLFLMTSASAINESSSCNSFFKSLYKNPVIGALVW